MRRFSLVFAVAFCILTTLVASAAEGRVRATQPPAQEPFWFVAVYDHPSDVYDVSARWALDVGPQNVVVLPTEDGKYVMFLKITLDVGVDHTTFPWKVFETAERALVEYQAHSEQVRAMVTLPDSTVIVYWRNKPKQ